MIVRSSLLAVALLLLAGCGRAEIRESPFSGTGALRMDGVLGVTYVTQASFENDWLDLWPEGLPPEARLIVLLLDPTLYGAGQAVVIAGVEPDLVAATLIESGHLVATEGGTGQYRCNLGRGVEPLGQILAGRLQHFGRTVNPSMKRYDRGDRLMLTPTVDLREDLFELSDAILRTVSPDTRLALAGDGHELARYAEESLLPLITSFSTVAGAAMEEQRDAIELLTFACRLGVELLRETEGIVVEHRGVDPARTTARLTAAAGSHLSECLRSLRPLAGDFPRIDQANEQLALELCFDAAALSSAFLALAEPALDDLSLENCEQIEESLKCVGSSGGRVWLAASSPGANLNLGFQVGPAFRLADIEALTSLLPGDERPWRVTDGWAVQGPAEPVLQSIQAGAGVAGRLWFGGATWERASWRGTISARDRTVNLDITHSR